MERKAWMQIQKDLMNLKGAFMRRELLNLRIKFSLCDVGHMYKTGRAHEVKPSPENHMKRKDDTGRKNISFFGCNYTQLSTSN